MAWRATAALNAEAEAIGTCLDGGWLVLYGGYLPTHPGAEPTGPELARLRFAVPAFYSPINGVAQARVLERVPADGAVARATWFRAYMADGVTAVLDGTVGDLNSDADLKLDDLLVGGDKLVDVTLLVYEAMRGTLTR
jgi:hypothetical protein